MNKETQKNVISRPPVVVVLGHVDHGKSSLIEKIKEIKITEHEAGGITQHIGAYEVAIENPPSSRQGGTTEGQRKITFIDTPGHEAFSAMRSRGAKVADIAILVVAGDEGVKPQTKEAISFIKKAGIPMLVAINKIDKSGANPEKVKRELAQEDVLLESLGGKIPSVEVSAATGKNLDHLLDLILLVAEMEELKADIEKPAQGVVIEAYLDSQRGPTATLLIREGILKAGDIIGTPSAFGKLKTLEDFQGKLISEALPSQPAVVLGFEECPQVGEKFEQFENLEIAKGILTKKEIKPTQGVIVVEPGQKVLNLILKADVLGSLEAIEGALRVLPQEKIVLRLLKKEVGEIAETDIKLAQSAKAKILGFRVKVNTVAQTLAENQNIKLKTFEVIYELIEAVRGLMERILEPETIKKELGKVKILALFSQDKNRQIIGGKVTEGEAKKGSLIEVQRADEKIGKGKLVELQENKKPVDSVPKGKECGIMLEGETKIEEGDVLVFYVEERRKGEL